MNIIEHIANKLPFELHEAYHSGVWNKELDDKINKIVREKCVTLSNARREANTVKGLPFKTPLGDTIIWDTERGKVINFSINGKDFDDRH